MSGLEKADIAEALARKPAAVFPARIGVVRVQAAGYRSATADGVGAGAFSVVTVQELVTDEHLRNLGAWPSVAGVAPLNRLLLPANPQSLEDLRLAAAKVQADVLLVYTLETSFRIQGRFYSPLSVFSLGLVPDRDAKVTATASALLVDVRTGFVYGLSESTAKESQLTNAWDSNSAVDRKRLEVEQQAFDQLIVETGHTWSAIVSGHAP